MLMAAQIAPAAPVVGNMGITGDAVLDTSDVVTAIKVVSWDSTTVNARSGTFTNVALGSPVILSPNWQLNSGPVTNFWSVGGFTLNLTSSTIVFRRGSFPGCCFHWNGQWQWL